MDKIHFETQDGMLCGQHALNSLLQGQYFSAVDLATLARSLDEREDQFMRESGTESHTYLQFLQQGSENLDDSGYFSVQVIAEALRVWNLEVVPFTHPTDPVAEKARADPTSQCAFICNYRQHWFTVRKLGFQWFNLNSLLRGPELISPTYLHLFLVQLQKDGYTIFVVKGDLPHCEADEYLAICPVDISTAAAYSASRPANSYADTIVPIGSKAPRNSPKSIAQQEEDDPVLQDVLELTRREHDINDPSLDAVLAQSLSDQEEEQLKMAISMSMQETTSSGAIAAESGSAFQRLEMPTHTVQSVDPAQLRLQRAQFLERVQLQRKTDDRPL